MLDRAQEFRERGFARFENMFSAGEAEGLIAGLEHMWQRLGQPSLVSQADVWHAPHVHVSPVGMTCAGILDHLPAAAAVLLRPELLMFFNEILGAGFELELGAGVLSDDRRPFFFWHHHVGGIDGEDHRGRSNSYPTFGRCERLACSLYASPLDDAHGVMLVWPRAVDASTAPPWPDTEAAWPGATEVRAPAGSVVILDQGTWHAVTPMGRPGRRGFVAFFVRRAGLAPTVRCDASLARAFARDPALAQAYGRGPR